MKEDPKSFSNAGDADCPIFQLMQSSCQTGPDGKTQCKDVLRFFRMCPGQPAVEIPSPDHPSSSKKPTSDNWNPFLPSEPMEAQNPYPNHQMQNPPTFYPHALNTPPQMRIPSPEDFFREFEMMEQEMNRMFSGFFGGFAPFGGFGFGFGPQFHQGFDEQPHQRTHPRFRFNGQHPPRSERSGEQPGQGPTDL
eukprot:TRINITY_DN9168_c0_g1_i1.p1 TRINITY_DN9168_c0_g1~~TRINITY_DN9168_c0_g1_i1.p1  ORF type:complete len:193 (-),score=41.89 TRINITY_DN9168_c0_g1_i1:555-1133(-)